MIFNPKFAKIKDISDRRRIPEVGRIRLGIKKQSARTGKEYPAEVDYFVCPEEVKAAFGEEPKELKIMFPANEIEVIFPQSYIWWGSSKGMKCRGNGEVAERLNDEGEFIEISCPCEKLDSGECKMQAQLRFLIPSVSMGGIYSISLGSYHSIVDVNSGIDYMKMLVGRVVMIPISLKREPKETHHEGKKQTHYTLKLHYDGNIESVIELKKNSEMILKEADKNLLPIPQFVNPKDDGLPPDVVEEDAKEEGAVVGKQGESVVDQPDADLNGPPKEEKEQEPQRNTVKKVQLAILEFGVKLGFNNDEIVETAISGLDVIDFDDIRDGDLGNVKEILKEKAKEKAKKKRF